MHRNYFTFERQVRYLDQELSGARIIDCFSYQKNELILEIESPESKFLRLGIDVQYPYILLDKHQNIKEPKIRFFLELVNLRIQNITITPFDKKINIISDIYRLEASFYGHSANIMLFEQSGESISVFKKKPTADMDKLQPVHLQPRDVTDSEFKTLAESHMGMPVESFIYTFTGGFNKVLARETCFRAGIGSEARISELKPADYDKLAITIRWLHNEIFTAPTKIIDMSDGSVILTLSQFEHLKSVENFREYESLNQAWIEFLHLSRQVSSLHQLRSTMLTALRKKTDYLSRTLKKIQDAEELEARKLESERKGHLLQTFAHQIPKRAAAVTLKNIFSDSQEEVEIKLNPAKTIQENARKYFEKFKNISEQKEQLAIKKDTFQDELTSWSALQERIASCSSLKELEKFQQQLIDKNILQSESDRKPDRQNLSYSFNRLLLGKKWEIFIGKNAKNNDLLTFQFARKFDLWFHAQGVPGSHVIIHLPDRGQHPPPQIIEQVASIAAYNSNARHSSTVPVNYTEVRYVRKPRKAPPGAVVISNEKTIFAKPVKYF